MKIFIKKTLITTLAIVGLQATYFATSFSLFYTEVPAACQACGSIVDEGLGFMFAESNQAKLDHLKRVHCQKNVAIMQKKTDWSEWGDHGGLLEAYNMACAHADGLTNAQDKEYIRNLVLKGVIVLGMYKLTKVENALGFIAKAHNTTPEKLISSIKSLPQTHPAFSTAQVHQSHTEYAKTIKQQLAQVIK
jgi:hypothetical protein